MKPLWIMQLKHLFWTEIPGFVQRKSYDKPTHIAQMEEPWSHLHSSSTLASTRRSAGHTHRVNSMSRALTIILQKHFKANPSDVSDLYCRIQETASISNSSPSTITARTSSGRRTRCYTRKRPSPNSPGACVTHDSASAILAWKSLITIGSNSAESLCLQCFTGNRRKRRRKTSECGLILKGVQFIALNEETSLKIFHWKEEQNFVLQYSSKQQKQVMLTYRN